MTRRAGPSAPSRRASTGSAPIDSATARRLVADAPALFRILTHPETGVILSVVRDSYRVPTALRRYLRMRDKTCTFWGCSRKAEACDLDHTSAWEHGGCTDHDNLAHLCRRHHTLKHHGGWSVSQEAAGPGTMRWTTPTGLVLVRPREAPASLLVPAAGPPPRPPRPDDPGWEPPPDPEDELNAPPF